ncbi:MAG: phosphoglycerate dehydrogenase [Bacillota bacterium]|nr:phosphoglycerate dehydrogenase [Bacillota bacterium]
MNFKIATLNSISNAIYEYLSKDIYSISKDPSGADALLVRSFNCHELELPENMLAIARAGAGVNNIPVEKCTSSGIVVFNTPGANANAVKELVIAGMLIASRNIVEAVNWAMQLKDTGEDVAKGVEGGKAQFVGPEISGKKLGVVGLGAIGAMVANDARALGMEVFGYDPFISVESAWRLSKDIHRAMNLESLVENCDFISIHVPLMEKTKGFFNAALFARMKKGAVLLNFARGELVDSAAVLKALEDGILAKYITDFPNNEVLGQKNVINIPHLGASTPESEENCAIMAARQLNDYLQYGNIKNSVNLPDCEMSFSDCYRITLIHANVTNMVGQITAVLATKKINIADMINKSRGNVAYTVLDLDDPVDEEVIKGLSTIEGVIRVRMLNGKSS